MRRGNPASLVLYLCFTVINGEYYVFLKLFLILGQSGLLLLLSHTVIILLFNSFILIVLAAKCRPYGHLL
jgi:hypothetical protein